MQEEDASEYDIKGLAILMRGLLVYFQIQLHFAEDKNIRSLGAAYTSYQGRLCRHHSIYTWESVRSFHISFHQTAINQGVRNPVVWNGIDTTLESAILVKRDKPLNSTDPRQGDTKGLSNNKMKPPCFRYNRGQVCTKGCTYRNNCLACGDNHSSKDCTKSASPNNNGQVSSANTVPLGKRS